MNLHVSELFGNTSLAIHVLSPNSLILKFVVKRFPIYLFFEHALLLAQSMKDGLTVNGCHRCYATLMADTVKLLVIYVFSTDSLVLHF